MSVKSGICTAVVITVLMATCSGCASTDTSGKTTHSWNGDRAATVSYLHARDELLHVWMAELSAGEASMERYVAGVRAECRGILRHVPERNSQLPTRLRGLVPLHLTSEQAAFLDELTEEGLERVQRLSQVAAAQRFAARVATMRWSDPVVTDLVHGYARLESYVLRSLPQNACVRAREWANGGYGKPPKPVYVKFPLSIRRMWDRADQTLKCGPFMGNSVLAALRQYQTQTAPLTTRQIELMELRFSFAESSARVEALRGLYDALGLRGHVYRRRHIPSLQELKRIPAAPSCSGGR